MANDDMLNSWKEVASYLGRGVRTVQRWEQELSLPVRRPWGKSRSAVIALKTEIDAWLHQSRTNPELVATSPADTQLVAPSQDPASMTTAHLRRSELHNRTEALVARMEQLVTRSHGLCLRTKALSEQVNHMIELTVCSLEQSGKKATQKALTTNGHVQAENYTL
jgi:hypothetical protein